MASAAVLAAHELREAIVTIQSLLNSSVYIDPFFYNIIDCCNNGNNNRSSSDNTKCNGGQCVFQNNKNIDNHKNNDTHRGEENEESVIKIKIIPSSSTSAPSTHNKTTNTCSQLTNHEIIHIFDSLKVIIGELIVYENMMYLSSSTSTSLIIQENYNYIELQQMIQEMLQILFHSIPPMHDNNNNNNNNMHNAARNTTTNNTSLFHFIIYEVLPLLKRTSSSSSLAYKGEKNNPQQQQCQQNKIETIRYFIMNMIPRLLVQQHTTQNLNTSIEKEVIHLVQSCLFPPSSNHVEHHITTDDNDYYYSDYKKSMMSIIQLIEYYPFQDCAFVLNDVLTNFIIPSLKGFILWSCNYSEPKIIEQNDDTNIEDYDELMVATCRVMFVYLKRYTDNTRTCSDNNSKNENDKPIKITKQKINSSSPNKIGEKNNHHHNLNGDAMSTRMITSLQTIRDVLLFYKQHTRRNHYYNYHKSEMKIISQCLPLIIESSSIAQGYTIMIQSLFGDQNDTNNNITNTRTTTAANNGFGQSNHNVQQHWTKLDLCVFCIIFFIYKHKSSAPFWKEIQHLIDILCNENRFPFHDLELLCNIDFLDLIDEKKKNQEQQKQHLNRNCNHSNILLSSMVEVVLYILLIPLRNPDYPKYEYNNYFFPSIICWDEKQQPIDPTTSPPSSLNEAVSSLHPIKLVLEQLQSLIGKLLLVLPVEKKMDVINPLLHFSSHNAFISTMLNSVFSNKIQCKAKSSKFQDRQRRNDEQRSPLLPCNLDRYLPKTKSSTKNNKYHIRHVYDVAFISVKLLCKIVKQNVELPRNFDYTRFRKIVLDRLQYLINSSCEHNLECNSKYKESSEYNAVTRDEILMLNFLMADEYSGMLVTMIEKEVDKDLQTENCKEAMLLFHNLILGSKFPFQFMPLSTMPLNVLDEGQRQSINKIIGIILGKNLVQSSSIQEEERNIIFDIITKLDLSSNSIQENTDILTFDPLLGYWIINFLCTSCPELMRKEQDNYYSGEKCKSHSDHSVSTIFKYIKKMVSRIGFVKLESDVLKNVTMKSDENEEPTVLVYQSLPCCFQEESNLDRKMVFSISLLLQYILNHGDLGINTIQWIRYIYMLLDMYLQIGRKLSPKWSADAWLLACFEFLDFYQDCRDANTDLNLVSHLSRKSLYHFTCRIPQDLSIQRGISLFLSISISCAVLRNCNLHYEHLESDFIKDRLHKLMQLSLAKIYDLQNKVQSIDYHYDDEGIISMESSTMIDDLMAIKVLFSSSSLIPLSLLWSCIKSDIHNIADNMISFVGAKMNNDNRESFACELWLKKTIILHIVNQLTPIQSSGGTNVSEQPKFYLMIDKQGIGLILRNTMSLIDWIQPLSERCSELEGIGEVGTVSFLTLLQHLKSLICVSFDCLQVSLEKVKKNEGSIQSWIIHKDMYSMQSICDELTQKTFHLDDLYISGKILDFVSLLSAACNLSVKGLSSAHWHQLIHNKIDRNVGYFPFVPHSLASFVIKEMNMCCLDSKMKQYRSTVLLDLLRTLVSLSGNYNDLIFCHHLCAHWAHTMSAESNFFIEYDILLKSLQYMVEKLALDVIQGSESKRSNYESSSQSRSTSNVRLHSISARCIPLAYELLLTLCASSLALNIVPENYPYIQSKDGKVSSNATGDMNNQIQTLNNFVSVFESSVQLYSTNFKLFPDTSLDAIIRETSVIMRALEVQIETCFQSGQGMSTCSPRKAGIHKAITALHAIFETVRKFALSTVEFCTMISSAITGDEFNDLSIRKRTAIKSLEVQCGKALTSLQSINGSHNYFLPSSLESLMDDVVHTSTSGTGSTNESKQVISGKGRILKRIKKSKIKKKKKHISDDDSDSFGAIGDWGNEGH